jgi:hypothetical protein
MSPDMPVLGRSRKRSPAPAVLIVLAVVLAGFFTWWKFHARKTAPPPAAPPLAAAPTSAPPPAPAAASDGGGASADAVKPAPAKVERSPADEELHAAGLKRLSATVNGPLETAVVQKVGGELGPRLVQVMVRSLVWWLAVPNDLLRDDQLDVLYEERPNEDPIVHAVRYKSGKNGRTYRAYLFKSADSAFARSYAPSGEELEARLRHAPLDDYEQVTSLLRDGRGHKGVDFKTPLGTTVKAPFDAVVVRKNWHFRGNGNSIELRESGGHGWTALFLHLQEPSSLKVGAHVSRGALVGKSGNTGHSFAPHLHYQLMAGQKVLDPFAVQETYHRKLPAEERKAFDAEVKRLDHLLDL